MKTASTEREAIVAWLTGEGGNIPALSGFAVLVSGNNQPCMSGDMRDRLRPNVRRAFDQYMQNIGERIMRGDHLKDQDHGRA